MGLIDQTYGLIGLEAILFGDLRGFKLSKLHRLKWSTVRPMETAKAHPLKVKLPSHSTKSQPLFGPEKSLPSGLIPNAETLLH